MLPDSVNSLDITGLRVGDSKMNVHYGRSADGRAAVQALQSNAGLQVKID